LFALGNHGLTKKPSAYNRQEGLTSPTLFADGEAAPSALN